MIIAIGLVCKSEIESQTDIYQYCVRECHSTIAVSQQNNSLKLIPQKFRVEDSPIL